VVKARAVRRGAISPDRPAVSPFSSTGFAVFAVFTGNYQRETAPKPQESSILGLAAAEGTARFRADIGLLLS
jgi:hypothetical protein